MLIILNILLRWEQAELLLDWLVWAEASQTDWIQCLTQLRLPRNLQQRSSARQRTWWKQTDKQPTQSGYNSYCWLRPYKPILVLLIPDTMKVDVIILPIGIAVLMAFLQSAGRDHIGSMTHLTSACHFKPHISIVLQSIELSFQVCYAYHRYTFSDV